MSKGKIQKLVLAGLIALIFISIAILGLSSGDSFVNLWPSAEAIKKASQDLEKAQLDLESKIQDLEKRRLSRIALMSESKSFWINSRDGQIESDLMKKTEQMAKNTGITLNNLGNMKMSKVNELFSVFDFTLESQGTMDQLAEFIIEIYKSDPKLYWTRFMLRPLNPNDSKILVLSGSLRVICIDDPNISEKLIEGLKK